MAKNKTSPGNMQNTNETKSSFITDIQFDQVSFMRVCDLPRFRIDNIIDVNFTDPDSASFDIAFNLAKALVKEESVKELLPAIEELQKAMLSGQSDKIHEALVQVFDGGLDTIYVIMQLFNVLDLPFWQGWREISDNNMSKAVPTGNPGEYKIRRRADGKILKPEGWEPPKLREIVNKHYQAAVYEAQSNGA